MKISITNQNTGDLLFYEHIDIVPRVGEHVRIWDENKRNSVQYAVTQIKHFLHEGLPQEILITVNKVQPKQ